MIKYKEERPVLDVLNDFIEFAEATNKLADVAFYKRVKAELELRERVINEFRQVCPERHPYLFITVDTTSVCPDCLLEERNGE